ncbi:hypothetical protein BGZ63DRAFT_410954 [Mariannaea sp. PMI_226]|nr:hypothetical protein BGZ63DRAFT_410954 [Mariannaea sp. PMI_226]
MCCMSTPACSQDYCGEPVRNGAKHINALIIALGVVAWIPLIQRFASKIWDNMTLGLDDWFALATALEGIAVNIVNAGYVVPNGLGKDIWTLEPKKIYDFGFYIYIATIFYLLQLTTLRLAMLFFYLRIFPSTRTRRVIWATICFVSLIGITFLGISIIPCWPITYLWNQWDGKHKGHCVDVNLMGWLNAACTIAMSVLILIIPLWQLKRLNLKRSKKLGVAAMFILGTFDTVVSVIRLSSLLGYANQENPTYANAEIVKWSTIEVNVGIICVCVPTTRLLLKKLGSRFFASTAPVYYEQNEPRSNNSQLHGRGWPLDNLASGPGTRTSSRPSQWQITTGEDNHEDGSHLSETIVKPEHGILHTKVFTTTYDEPDEEELISHRRVAK